MINLEEINKSIEDSRNNALNILNPSQEELEYGLKLHEENLVFDAYGFAPFSAFDGDFLEDLHQMGALQNELKDLREDMMMTRHITDSDAFKEYKIAWEASGVDCIFQNSGEEGQSPLQMLKRLARYTYCSDKLTGFLKRVACPDDVIDAKNQNLRSLYMTTNGVPLAQQWQNEEEELSYIKVFYQLGCRMMHMTYNRRNMIGDGCLESSNAGLSGFGKTVVREMNEIGMICDVAHSGWQTSIDVARISSSPVVCSHSSCYSLYEHPRGKTNEVIKAIVDSGGYIGICCFSGFLGETGDINTFLDHIDYVIKNFGADHVAIGTDVPYYSYRFSDEWEKIINQTKSRPLFESFWPSGSLPGENHSSLAWTNWPLFTVGLVQRGHSEEVIRKIIGGNVMRVIKDVIK